MCWWDTADGCERNAFLYRHFDGTIWAQVWVMCDGLVTLQGYSPYGGCPGMNSCEMFYA